MSLKFSVLCSGSTGNAFYIESSQKRFIVDIGVSGKQFQSLMQEIHQSPEGIDGIFVTHEHIDHIRGIGVIARRFNVPIYANEKTWNAMSQQVGKLETEQKCVFHPGTIQTFEDMDVESFQVSHDAADPMFYVFRAGGKKVTIMTDTGYVSEKMKRTIENSHAFVFESNYDPNMLQMGSYPWKTKQRILGDYGHLSNEDAAYALTEVIGDETSKIYLAHRSLDNNMKDLAHLVVKQTLEEHNFDINGKIKLYDTEHSKPTPLVRV